MTRGPPGRAERRPHPISARAQRGVVALLAILLLLTSGAFFLLRSLNEAARSAAAAEATTNRALAEARLALLGYAVRYPDNPETPDLDAGPGHLPCPDTQADAGPGQADPPCASSGGTETGLLPWHTLGLSELLDGSGAPLWYAVSDNFRNSPKNTVNSTTRGTLGVDRCNPGGDDVAAVIIAPGPPLGAQTRAAAPYDPTQYLEGQNATRGDNCFSTRRAVDANDRLLVITGRELRSVVEQRVLAEVATALDRYRRDPDADDVAGADPDCPTDAPRCDDGYPWLSPFADPSTSTFTGVVGTRRGWLPLRRTGADFAAPFVARWSLPSGGTYTSSGSDPPSKACLRSSGDPTCEMTTTTPAVALAGDVLGVAGDPWYAGSCRQDTGHALVCVARRRIVDSLGAVFERRYEIDLTRVLYRIVAPDASTVRRQAFVPSGTTLATDAHLRIEETDCRIAPDGSCTLLGTAVLDLPGGTPVALFELHNVPFDLEEDDDDIIDTAPFRSPGELPHWFVANGWPAFIYVAYAAAHAPGDAASDCATHVAGCLTVHWQQAPAAPLTTLDTVAGVVLSAGAPIETGSLAQVRPSARLQDYFEGANATDDDDFEQRPPENDFNDRVRLLVPAD